MVILERTIKVVEVEIDADLDHPDVSPFFYSVPCAGVKTPSTTGGRCK